jgi:hypothetical protein
VAHDFLISDILSFFIIIGGRKDRINVISGFSSPNLFWAINTI